MEAPALKKDCVQPTRQACDVGTADPVSTAKVLASCNATDLFRVHSANLTALPASEVSI